MSTEGLSMPAMLSPSARHRRAMVDGQIRTYEVTDRALLTMMEEVERERFLPPAQAEFAYSDRAIRVGARTLLAPMVLARMLQGGAIQPSDAVLDVGANLGYCAAILAGLALRVVALESEPALAAQARANLADLATVRVVEGPLPAGAPAEGPFDVIFVEGAIEEGHDALVAQLRDGGRLIAIMPGPKPTAGVTGQASRLEKIAGHLSGRPLFSAAAATLPGFARAPRFIF